VKDFTSVRDAIAAAGLEIENAELTMIPQSTVALDADQARKVLKLLDVLEDHDDVQEVYANFDIPEEVLAEVG
jgi:transcriptional/translational regulatory protein YebC/TACO1